MSCVVNGIGCVRGARCVECCEHVFILLQKSAARATSRCVNPLGVVCVYMIEYFNIMKTERASMMIRFVCEYLY